MIVTCESLAKRLTEVEEGAASGVVRASLRFHLSICARCRRYVAELRAMKEALAESKTVSRAPTETSVGTALAAFRAWSSAPDEDP